MPWITIDSREKFGDFIATYPSKLEVEAESSGGVTTTQYVDMAYWKLVVAKKITAADGNVTYQVLESAW